VTIANATERFVVAAAFGPGAIARLDLPSDAGAAAPLAEGIAYADPRLPALGARLLLPRAAGIAALEAKGFSRADSSAYDRLRLSLGIPDGSRDLPVEKAILLEAGFDELNGVDWEKGCYIGQELTARTKYRALIKKRLMPVKVEGPLPAPGSPVMLGDQDAGEIRSGSGDMALALLRLEMVEAAATSGTPLMAGGVRVRPVKPEWAKF
jgi:folate-binding protein YgfZ